MKNRSFWDTLLTIPGAGFVFSLIISFLGLLLVGFFPRKTNNRTPPP